MGGVRVRCPVCTVRMFKYFPTVTKQFYPTQPKQSLYFESFNTLLPSLYNCLSIPQLLKFIKKEVCKQRGGGVGIDF